MACIPCIKLRKLLGLPMPEGWVEPVEKTEFGVTGEAAARLRQGFLRRKAPANPAMTPEIVSKPRLVRQSFECTYCRTVYRAYTEGDFGHCPACAQLFPASQRPD